MQTLPKSRVWVAGAFCTLAIIALTPFGDLLEATMTSHVLIEMPLLIAIGAILGVQSKASVSCRLALFNCARCREN